MRRAIGIALAMFVLGAPAGAQQARFVGLGDLPDGPFSSAANDVAADASVVVGVSLSDSGTAPEEAFRWTSAGGMLGLGSQGGLARSEAHAVNAAGSVIVGSGGTGSAFGEATRWTNGSVLKLGFLPGGIAFSRATDVSENGSVIVGFGGLDSTESSAERSV